MFAEKEANLDAVAFAAVEAVWQIEPEKRHFLTTFLLFLTAVVEAAVHKEMEWAVQAERKTEEAGQ